MPYLGEAAALSTAIFWVVSSLSFAVASRTAGAQATNQFRLFAALPMLLGIAWLVTGTAWPVGLEAGRLWLLAGSGVVGLVVGDYGYFHALATIGPRLASVVMALWPACTLAIDAACGELPTGRQLLGIAATLAGVTLVLLQRSDPTAGERVRGRQWLLGVAGAALGAVGQAVGFVIAGVAMRPGPDLPAGLAPILATVVRLTFAVAGVQVLAALQRQPFALQRVFHQPKALGGAVVGALFGPVGGVWLSMVARRHAADPGVAAALMATTPIFLLPVSVFVFGARVGGLGWLGTMMAVAGVVLCLVSA